MRGRTTFLRKYWPEFLLLLFSVGLFLQIDANLETRLDIDSHRYMELGLQILDTGRFEHVGLTGELTPDYSRTPTLPLLIALSFSIWGTKSAAGLTFIIWLQRLAWISGVCWLLPKIRSTSGRIRPWSLTGKCVLLFSPVVLYHSSLLLTDVFYAAGLMAAVRFTSVAFYRAPLRMAIVGVAHGVLTLLRPVHLLVPLLLGLPFLKRYPLNAIVLVMVSLILPAGWMLRNHAIHGNYSLVALDGRALALHRENSIRNMQPAESDALYGPEFIAALHSTNENPITAAWILMRDYRISEIQADKTAKAVALEAIRLNPAAYFKQSAANLGRLFFSRIDGLNTLKILDPQAGEPYLRVAGIVNGIWGIVMFFLLPVLLLASRIPSRLLKRPEAIALILLGLYVTVIPAFTTVTYGRFVLPLLPVIGLIYCMADVGRLQRNSAGFSKTKSVKKIFPDS